MAERPPLYVVAPMLDQPEHTLALLACLAEQTLRPTSVRLLDNGSTPKTLRAIEDGAPAELVVIVEAAPGLTIYELWNRGYWHAQQCAAGDPFHVLVVNNDVLLPLHALEWMSQALVEGDDRGAAYPNWRAPWPGSLAPGAGKLVATQETHGVWGSDGMLGYCFLLAGHRIPWRPLVQDLAYQWWFGDNALAESLAFAGLKQVKVLGLPIQHAHEGTAHAHDLAREKERDAKLWATRRRLEQVDRLNRGARSAGRRDWRQQRPPARPPRGA